MMRFIHRLVIRIRSEEGASALEMALACTIFLAMLIGAFQMTLAFYAFHYVSDAAREASRYAMVRGSTCSTNTPNQTNCNATSDQIQTYVRGIAYPGITAGNLTVTTTWCAASAPPPPTTWSACSSGTSNAPGNLVKVVATYAYPVSIPFVPNFSINLSSTSRMVIAQ